MENLNNELGSTVGIDPVQEAYFEKVRKVQDNVLKQLKGLTYAEANNVLSQCSWEIQQKAVIK